MAASATAFVVAPGAFIALYTRERAVIAIGASFSVLKGGKSCARNSSSGASTTGRSW